MYISDKKNLIRIVSFGAIFVLALPFGFGKLTGISYWFSPFLMLNSIFVLKSFVLLNFIGFIILLLTWIKKRWFCKYICPIGFSFDIVTKCCPSKQELSISKVPRINNWLAVVSLIGALCGLPVFLFLDPMVIFNGFFVSFIHPFDYSTLLTLSIFPLLLILQIYVPGLWCGKLCPLGGLQLSISALKKKSILHPREKKSIWNEDY